jgi:hypothetical protein
MAAARRVRRVTRATLPGSGGFAALASAYAIELNGFVNERFSSAKRQMMPAAAASANRERLDVRIVMHVSLVDRQAVT